MEAAGIEPAVDCDGTNASGSTSDNRETQGAANALHFCRSCQHNCSGGDSELQEIVMAWEDLPTVIRSAILGLVRSQRES
jgi:hypothetical protein